MQPDSLIVEDLSALRGTPQERKEQQELRVAAARGLDIIAMAPTWWPVCSTCNLMTQLTLGKTSGCCGALVRVQGWAP